MPEDIDAIIDKYIQKKDLRPIDQIYDELTDDLDNLSKVCLLITLTALDLSAERSGGGRYLSQSYGSDGMRKKLSVICVKVTV